jgi:AraC-like DNA-binding protein
MAVFPLSAKAKRIQSASSAVVALARDYEHNDVIATQQHRRGQLLYAVEGVMRVRTPDGVWIIPPRRALWIPGSIRHEVTMLSKVSMRTIYIAAEKAVEFGTTCRLLEVSGLLRELILGLIEEPVEYPAEGRGGLLARLILRELSLAPNIPIEIPWPRDRRLIAVCETVVENPGQHRNLDDWAEIAGASARTLIRLFPRETGLNFRHWIQQVHLAEALCSLTRGDSIGEISRKLGYNSPSAFTTMFRRALGVTPSQYLNEKAR